VGQALSSVVGAAESKRREASEDELHPRHDWQGFSNHSMRLHHDLPYLPVNTLLEVELEVDAHGDLGDEHGHDVWDELGVDVRGELSAFMLVAEEVSDDCEEGAECLYGDVPFRADYLVMSDDVYAGVGYCTYTKYHACRENDPPCHGLYQYVYP
jgi:hypothetical protein